MAAKRERGKKRIFLLSPANLSGRRAQILLGEAASFELATHIRSTGARLGDVFSFVSGLYFRGKLAYANRFAEPDNAGGSIFIITATRGLIAPDAWIDHPGLVEMAGVPIRCADERYLGPLERDLAKLAARIGTSAEVVLLGSIATPKYVAPLSKVFGERLLVPRDFIGRGDMSRGALLLRAVREMAQLTYVPAVWLPTGLPKPLPEPRRRGQTATGSVEKAVRGRAS
jgi:hypothetical protein